MFNTTTAGAQVPITNYTCTQPNLAGLLDQGQCTVSGGIRTCAIKNGTSPALLSSSADLGGYAWDSSVPPYPNPFVVLDIPQGWCAEKVKMTFGPRSSIPALSISVHTAERLSTNTDRTMILLVSEKGTMSVVMNFTTVARGKYLRINMTLAGRLYLTEIKVIGTSRYTFTDTSNLQYMLTLLLTSLNMFFSITDGSICTHPPPAVGDPTSPTTSVGSSTYSVTSTCEYTILMFIVSIHCSLVPISPCDIS